MAVEHLSETPRPFRYQGKTHQPKRAIRIRGRKYLVIQDFGSRAWAFDPATQAMCSIRVRQLHHKSQELHVLRAATKDNTHIPAIIDVDRSDTHEYLVQVWLSGSSLESYRERGELPFNVERAYRLGLGLAIGVNRLHTRNLFHGDINPKNLIVSPPERLIMIDFGAAWNAARAFRRPNESSAGYSAPEQHLAGALVDHRADQFAVSCVLYEMLTGELPYNGNGSLQDSSASIPPLRGPRAKNRDVWPSLDQVVVRGLGWQREDRFETSGAWLQALRNATPPNSPFHALLKDLKQFFRK
jgi:serine/threonine protein kinase